MGPTIEILCMYIRPRIRTSKETLWFVGGPDGEICNPDSPKRLLKELTNERLDKFSS